MFSSINKFFIHIKRYKLWHYLITYIKWHTESMMIMSNWMVKTYIQISLWNRYISEFCMWNSEFCVLLDYFILGSVKFCCPWDLAGHEFCVFADVRFRRQAGLSGGQPAFGMVPTLRVLAALLGWVRVRTTASWAVHPDTWLLCPPCSPDMSDFQPSFFYHGAVLGGAAKACMFLDMKIFFLNSKSSLSFIIFYILCVCVKFLSSFLITSLLFWYTCGQHSWVITVS